MPDPDLSMTIAQFGAAGLMGWMWLSERRAASTRERQLSEAHDRIAAERTGLAVLLHAIESNTRALTTIEVGQRELVTILSRWTSPAPHHAFMHPPTPATSTIKEHA
ncbi:MAG: hypothetical protein ACT4PL_11260 [Phycisphaerales bacterium]